MQFVDVHARNYGYYIIRRRYVVELKLLVLTLHAPLQVTMYGCTLRYSLENTDLYKKQETGQCLLIFKLQ